MRIKSWDIWHVFSTVFFQDSLNLEEVARSLVASRLSPLVVRGDGCFWWFHNGEIREGFTQIDLKGVRDSEGEFSAPSEQLDSMDTYSQEMWFQFSYLIHCERRVLGRDVEGVKFSV